MADRMIDDIRLLFRETANLTANERARYCREHNVPPDVRAELESLLLFDRGETGSLTRSVAGVAEDFFDAEPEDRAGSRYGPWEIIRLLGRGGMGAVYLARRADGEVEQVAAVKLIHEVAAGASFRENFLRERRILARLSHSGIARLLDAGRTSEGQPWLAMEYIDGVPIDRYAEALALRARLQLFLKVCGAVASAHRSLVIHRDLKPSNILVDEHGEPRLLDFGIARISGEGAPAGASLTRERLLTPEYASPEQIAGYAHTTATDIYSLGAVFYKVLTGRPPHVAKPGGDTVESLVCSEDAVVPSRFNPALPRDLDFVLSKALRRKIEGRYSSVENLADDLTAVLESRAVAARAGSGWYRTRKLLRRYWLPVTAVAVVLCSLSAGLYIAERERAAAQQRFLDLRHLAANVLRFDEDIRNLPGSTGARQKLAAQALDYLDGLSRQTHGDRGLELELANGYVQLAEIQGVPVRSNLGQFAAAAESLKKADQLATLALAHDRSDPAALVLKAESAQDAMILADSQRDENAAVARARACIAALGELRAGGRASREQEKEMARIYMNAGLALQNRHLFDEAIQVENFALTLARSSGAPQRYIASALSILANTMRQAGDPEAALKRILEARQVAERATFDSPTERSLAMYGILLRHGEILGAADSISLNRPREAADVLRQALEIVDRQASQDALDATSRDRAGTIARSLGDVLLESDPAQALQVYDLGIARQRELRDNRVAKRLEALLLARSANVLLKTGRTAEAAKRIEAAFSLLRLTGDFPSATVQPGSAAAEALFARGEQESAAGASLKAVDTWRDLLAGFAAAQGKPQEDLSQAPIYSEVYRAMAASERAAGKPVEAAELDTKRLTLWRAWDRRLPERPYILGQIAAASRDRQE